VATLHVQVTDVQASINLRIQRLESNPDLPLPAYAYDGDAGLDLRSNIDITLAPGQRALIPTGLAMAIPPNYAGFVLPRSGLAARQGLTLVNAPGLIDSHYRGEVQVVALNTSQDEPIVIQRGDRIAQLVLLMVPRVEIIEQGSLESTSRGSGGFGSSGKQ